MKIKCYILKHGITISEGPRGAAKKLLVSLNVTDYMTKNPFINALSGLLYIVVVVSLVYYSSGFGGNGPSIFFPIAVLSLFVFSAASMGYIFLYQPLQLFLEGEKKKSVDLFLTTLGIFAISAATLVLMGLYLTHH